MSSSGGCAEFILESSIARYGTLGDKWSAIHVWRLHLRLTTPMHCRSFTRKPVDHVDDQDIILTNLQTNKHVSRRVNWLSIVAFYLQCVSKRFLETLRLNVKRTTSTMETSVSRNACSNVRVKSMPSAMTNIYL